jgi:membrane protease YdiL (CAAX protease family)
MDTQQPGARPGLAWTAWVVAALLALELSASASYLVLVTVSAALLCLVPGVGPVRRERTGWEHSDLLWIAGLYAVVVALMRVAFVGFTVDHVAGLFLCFAAALLVGTVGPVVVTVWVRGRPLADLGLGVGDLRTTVTLAVLFAGVQFSLTLWGLNLPAAGDWVPLLVMALVVGVFESVFFRGFVQSRLEAAYGPVAGVAGAAVLYGAYHVGYGMGLDEILFLTGLGVVYAVAFALTRSVIVLWPLLTPLGSFFSAVDAGDIDLPWASIAGFADVLAVMLVAGWLAHRHATHDAGTGRGHFLLR